MTQPLTEDDVGADIPHLRQMDKMTVANACMSLLALDLPIHIRQELDGWRESRTPHDSARLTNALWYWQLRTPNPQVISIIADIDAAADECAGCQIPNRHLREDKP
jgi:hypothetical protein